jgi:hypothetical protein
MLMSEPSPNPCCPTCGYDLHDRAFPTTCSECGTPVGVGLLEGMLPWEREPQRRVRALLRTFAVILFRPCKTSRLLARRADVPIFRCYAMLARWVLLSGLIMLTIAATRHHLFGSLYASCCGFSTRFTISSLPIELSASAAVWLFFAALVAVLGRPCRLLALDSALAILGPYFVVLSTGVCAVEAVESFLPEVVAIRWPYVEAISVLVLLACFGAYALHLVFTMRRLGRRLDSILTGS